MKKKVSCYVSNFEEGQYFSNNNTLLSVALIHYFNQKTQKNEWVLSIFWL